jgi:hypothetical protein
MTTQDFIRKNYGISSYKERRCSSVFADNDGNIYSYGYHYPLLFEVDGKTFVNDTGYSSTTGKHIRWAKGAMGYCGYINVKLDGARLPLDMATIIEKLHKEKSSVESRINHHISRGRKTDTQVYRAMLDDLLDVNNRLEVASV